MLPGSFRDSLALLQGNFSLLLLGCFSWRLGANAEGQLTPFYTCLWMGILGTKNITLFQGTSLLLLCGVHQLLLCHIPHSCIPSWCDQEALLVLLQSSVLFKRRSVSFAQPDPESVAENCAGAIPPNDFSPPKQVEVPEKTKSLGAKHTGDSISDTVSYVS